MRKKELELALLQWSNQETRNGPYKNHPIEVQRVYQTGLILGLLSSICENDFYAKKLVMKKLCLKD